MWCHGLVVFAVASDTTIDVDVFDGFVASIVLNRIVTSNLVGSPTVVGEGFLVRVSDGRSVPNCQLVVRNGSFWEFNLKTPVVVEM